MEPFGPLKNCVNFNIFNRLQIRVFCVMIHQSLTKINYCCTIHGFLSIKKTASINSSIYFGYIAIAASFEGPVSFESTKSELKFFTRNL